MRIYELMFFSDTNFPEEERDAGVEKVKKLIEERVNGVIEKVDRWGVRKLAYTLPKSKMKEGDYCVVLFRAEGNMLEPLENLFHVTPMFVRKQIVRRDDIEKAERQKLIKNRKRGDLEIEEESREEKTPEAPETEPEFDVSEKGE